jgi:DNA-binding beta-propeller fold protein YncE
LGNENWTLLAEASNGTAGNTSTLLSYPAGVTFDPMGNMYVADANNHRIQFFIVGQSVGITIAGISGISGNNSTMLNIPQSVELDNQLNLYVADTLNQ